MVDDLILLEFQKAWHEYEWYCPSDRPHSHIDINGNLIIDHVMIILND